MKNNNRIKTYFSDLSYKNMPIKNFRMKLLKRGRGERKTG